MTPLCFPDDDLADQTSLFSLFIYDSISTQSSVLNVFICHRSNLQYRSIGRPYPTAVDGYKLPSIRPLLNAVGLEHSLSK